MIVKKNQSIILLSLHEYEDESAELFKINVNLI